GEKSHHGDEREEEDENRKRDPLDLTGHDRALRHLRGFVARKAAIDQPDQERGDRYPRKLVPIEERKAEQRGLGEIVEGHPEQADERDQQQNPHGGTPSLQPAPDAD